MKNMNISLGGCLLILAAFSSSCQKSLQPASKLTGSQLTANSTSAPLLANTNSVYWTDAQQTHNFVVGNILTTYNSYKADSAKPTTAYEWYNASQIYADAEMVLSGDSRYTSYMNNSYSWMNNMWDNGNPNGGYFSAANVNGTGAGGDKYVDDNSLSGVTYLDCYNVTTGTTQTNYLNSAKACANWLMNGGLWDTTYGGGFWWSTAKTLKPTQSNGLAMQSFLRLYQITGQSYYKNWAISVKNWLESNMYDDTTGLYIWEIQSGAKQYVYFTYDNAIMMEADLLYYQIIGDTSYLSKAQAIAGNMNTTLWNSTHNVYIFNTTDPRVNPAWCGWASQSLMQLYDVDKNSTWLDYAQKNIDYINANLRNTANYGYFQFRNLDGTGLYSNMEGVDQAWMERIQGMMANYR